MMVDVNMRVLTLLVMLACAAGAASSAPVCTAAQSGTCAMMSAEELGAFVEGYRTNPCPEKIAAMIRSAAAVCDKRPSALAPVAGFLGRVFRDNEGRASEWRKEVARLDKGAFRSVLEHELNGRSLLPESGALPPHLLDYCWGAYSASGDLKYVDQVVDTAFSAPQKGKANVGIYAARWSVCSIAGRDPAVRKRLNERLRKADDKLLHAFFEHSKPGDLKSICEPDVAARALPAPPNGPAREVPAPPSARGVRAGP